MWRTPTERTRFCLRGRARTHTHTLSRKSKRNIFTFQLVDPEPGFFIRKKPAIHPPDRVNPPSDRLNSTQGLTVFPFPAAAFWSEGVSCRVAPFTSFDFFFPPVGIEKAKLGLYDNNSKVHTNLPEKQMVARTNFKEFE